MKRLLWPLWLTASSLFILSPILIWASPYIEVRYWPIRGPQSIRVIERTPERLCWAWTFTKLRDVASDNIDAFLTINGQPGGVSMVYEMESGRPWGLTKYAVSPRPEPYTLHQCAPLPPYVRENDEVMVRQVAYYPGFGPWRLSVPFPDVVSNPEPGFP